MAIEKPRLAAAEAEYRALHTRVAMFCAELAKQLSLLVARRNCTGRTRTVTSEELGIARIKLRRLPAAAESLREVQDLVGLRLMLLFRRDIDRVGMALEGSLRVTRAYDADELLRDDQFGYSWRHYVVGPGAQFATKEQGRRAVSRAAVRAGVLRDRNCRPPAAAGCTADQGCAT
jgi:ppGpp synthetase/RelA/SpoT-type nucleotidyltranferase